jgi:two-component system sensor histidine kinase AtoS
LIAAACHRDHAVEISVRDDGPGIPPDKLERIFEAYYTTKEKGSGLGLAIVKHNAELYGGTASVESKLGNGAKFTVIFPAKALMKFSR